MSDSGAANHTDDAIASAEYLVPLRWEDDFGLEEFTRYLATVAQWMPVTVVDGSDEPLFSRHREAWHGIVSRHLEAPKFVLNGKADGVLMGLASTACDAIVIADDDVRWSESALRRALSLLDRADLVRPQNFFDPLPWHARWDTARSLVNRAIHSDYPGTLVVRRSALPTDAFGTPTYDGNVLFENLELMRTVEALGGVEVRADDLFVRRLPPSAKRFAEQRVRQAYDSAAQPARAIAELALLPILLHTRRRRPWLLIGLVAASILVAETGRRRDRGQSVYPPSSALWAPAWMLERSVCAWLALAHRLSGGMRYCDRRLPVAAHSLGHLRQRFAQAATPTTEESTPSPRRES